MSEVQKYIPYTYLIGWTHLNKWYYGSETSNRKYKIANPNNLWKTYFTSSKYVKEFCNEFGNPNVIEIRKTFVESKTCVLWEAKVLKRLKVINDDKWLNKAAGYLFDPECTRKAMIGNKHALGRKLSEFHIEAIRKANLGNKHTLGKKFGPMPSETKKKISDANKGKPKPDGIKQILSERMKNFNKTAWNKSKPNLKMQGTKFYNNGVIQKMFIPGQQPKEWILGRIKNARSA
jgi:hypothetical protein